MPFRQQHPPSEDVSELFGKYHSTFRSENEQVSAHLFERDGWLVAHVSFAPPWHERSATDDYRSELLRLAKEHGFEGRLQIRFS